MVMCAVFYFLNFFFKSSGPISRGLLGIIISPNFLPTSAVGIFRRFMV